MRIVLVGGEGESWDIFECRNENDGREETLRKIVESGMIMIYIMFG